MGKSGRMMMNGICDKDTMLSIVVAADQNNAIGLKGRLLCHLPNDMRYFKQLTVGHTVIMGRQTYESLPVRPLPDRRNIVLSTTLTTPPRGCELARDVATACRLGSVSNECFIIGGAQIYRAFFAMASKIYLTRIHHSFDADVWFPEVTLADWQQLRSEWYEPDEKHAYAYSFEVYLRRPELRNE